MKSIDVKSLLIGILGTAMVMVLMGVAHKKGSYQIACSERCHLLNTNTGVVKMLIPPEKKSLHFFAHTMGREADF